MPMKRCGPGTPPTTPVHATSSVEADRWREQGRYIAKGAAATIIGVLVASWAIVIVEQVGHLGYGLLRRGEPGLHLGQPVLQLHRGCCEAALKAGGLCSERSELGL